MQTYEQTGEKAKPSFQLSPDTRKLADKFIGMKPGEQVTYEQLNALVPGRDVQDDARKIMDHARKIARDEDNAVIECVHGIGMERITNDNVPRTQHRHLAQVRHQAKEGAAKLQCADMSSLSAEKQSQVMGGLALFGTIQLFTKAKSVKQVHDAAAQQQTPMVTDAVIELFTR